MKVNNVILSEAQNNCLNQVIGFVLNGESKAFVLSGVAGSGKSTIIRSLIAEISTMVQWKVVCPTGKATTNLVSRGINAATIHSQFYKPIIDERGKLLGFKFTSGNFSAFGTQKLLVVDEASMVTHEVFTDLISLNIPILFVGDSEQLPSVDGFNVMECSDVHLTEVHRQAAENPIIHLSKTIRETGSIKKSLASNEVSFISKHEITKPYLTTNQYDAILCGTNKVRQKYNNLVRAAKGIDSEIPVPSDVVICMRNFYTKKSNDYASDSFFEIESERTHLFSNGERAVVLDVGPAYVRDSIVVRDFKLNSLDNSSNANVLITIPDACWDGNAADIFDSSLGIFDYGYALTVHKSQGSSFKNVLFVDEDVSYFLDRRKFRYTAVTRAEQKITIAG